MSRQLRKGLSINVNDYTEDSFIADGNDITSLFI